jgi:cephalosporin hydroxylase
MEDKITRKINLDENDGLSAFLGMHAQQSHNAFLVFYEFIKKVKPVRILEIGTALGGFTQFLKWVSDDINHPMNILSYDIHEHDWYKEMINNGIDIRIENVFSNNYDSVESSVINFIQNDGVTVVLCDGGYKIGEFNILSKYIKPGDFIMAHDYSENKEIFESKINRKIWNWFEISNDDIIQSCIDNNLIVYEKEIFEDVVWTCRKKIITT